MVHPSDRDATSCSESMPGGCQNEPAAPIEAAPALKASARVAGESIVTINTAQRDTDSEADTPLITHCWRALRRSAGTAAEERDAVNQTMADFENLACQVSVELHSLRRILADPRWNSVTGWPAEARKGLLSGMDRIGERLRDASVELSAPMGAPYEGELLERFENIAQEPRAGIVSPILSDILAPAVAVRGHWVRAGEAVIGIPISTILNGPASGSGPAGTVISSAAAIDPTDQNSEGPHGNTSSERNHDPGISNTDTDAPAR